MSDYAPPPKKKRDGKKKPSFRFPKNQSNFVGTFYMFGRGHKQGSCMVDPEHRGTSSVAHVCLVVFFFFFFLLHAVTHTRSSVPEERAVGRRRGRPVKCDRLATPPKQQLQCDHQLTLLREMEEKKKTTVVLHRRKQIAVRVSPVVFPVPAAGSCCCLDLLAGEGGVNTRPWMLPLLRKRHQCPL